MNKSKHITRCGRSSSDSLNRFLMLILALTLGVTYPVKSIAQTADYGLEAETVEQSDGAETEFSGGAVDVAPALIPGAAASLGAEHSSARNSGASGRSAMLRYDQHREITRPDYATIHIGPLYSNVGISQSVGYRYTRLSGTGVDYLEGNRRGDVRKGGSEFPMVSGISLNNYMIITPRMDLEANISVNYLHYPMRTQDDELQINLSDEGIFATFSTQFTPSRNSKILVYDDILYRTDYVDTRGLGDQYGGQEYEHIENTLGLDWDWKPNALNTFSASGSRQDIVPLTKAFDFQKGVRYAEIGSYRRSLTPFAAAGLLGAASQSFYNAPERPDVYIYGISAFTGVRLTPRWTGDGSLGYQFSTSTGGLLDEDVNNRGVIASLGLENEISEMYRQRLSWQRSMTEAFDGGVDMTDTLAYSLSWNSEIFPGSLSTAYSVYDPQTDNRNGYADWATSLSVRHQLTRLLNLSLNATYAIRMNDDPVRPVSTVTTETVDTLPDLSSDYETLTLSASTGFRVTKNTTLSAYASRADRTSENTDLAYTRDTVGVMLNWSHQF